MVIFKLRIIRYKEPSYWYDCELVMRNRMRTNATIILYGLKLTSLRQKPSELSERSRASEGTIFQFMIQTAILSPRFSSPLL